MATKTKTMDLPEDLRLAAVAAGGVEWLCGDLYKLAHGERALTTNGDTFFEEEVGRVEFADALAEAGYDA